MRRSRFNEEQVIGILKEHTGGAGGGGALSEVRHQRRDVLQVTSRHCLVSGLIKAGLLGKSRDWPFPQ